MSYLTENSIASWQRKVHQQAQQLGWWDNGERNFGELIALIHSEASEAYEDWRAGREPATFAYEEKGNGSLPKPVGIPSEMADIVIRVMDLCEFYGINLERAMDEKHLYNGTRGYRHGGKRS